ncbi:FAD:protein FMN transferase [Stieleria varia]|uniref:FAD:protein FMN transferase n=1 Tax=Stieleria varia TaxID=2528005 RepID=A0A5C6AGG5_9BACT|nr:FAD:protein FMN transferase [Stieleria varia]TWT98517.1 Thiamine biosynthesis lipoprotein ApbE precursor [Stieleria varia]
MPSGPLLTSVSHRAMATEFVVMLPATDAHLVDAALNALESLDAIEKRLTVYDPESEVSAINRSAADSAVAVSELTFELLTKSLLWSHRTQGAFDVTAGPLITAWGFTQRRGRKPSRLEVESALQSVGHEKVLLDEIKRTVQFTQPGVAINLGAIGKGHALDILLTQLVDAGIRNALIHGGNSSVIAIGDQEPESDSEDRHGWLVGLAHPTKPGRRVAGVRLKNGALSTSGSGKQFFHHQGRRYGHVIDPRTGYPAGDLLSLTVIEANATDAEAQSTGYFVIGREGMRTTMAEHDLPPLIAVAPGNRQDEVRIEVINGESSERFELIDAI